jgi:hypothetical protein
MRAETPAGRLDAGAAGDVCGGSYADGDAPCAGWSVTL